MIKKIITFILNFALAMLALATIFIVLVSNTVLNKSYLMQVFEKNNYYELVYKSIKNGFENYTMQSGLELTIIEDLFTEEQVKEDINKKIVAIFEEDDVTIDVDEIKAELNSRIEQTLIENNRVPTESEQESINMYEDTMIELYQEGILYGNQIHIDSNMFMKYLKYIVGLIIIDIILNLLINRKFSELIKGIGIVFLTNGIILASLKFLIISRIQNVLILDTGFSNSLKYMISDVLSKAFYGGITISILGILIIIIISKNNLKNKIIH